MSDTGVRQVLTFSAGGQALALDALRVSEVAPFPRLTRVPQSPEAFRGLANIRGRVLPVVGVDVLVGGSGQAHSEHLIVLGGSEPLGLAVESIGGMWAVQAGAGEHLVTSEGPVRLLDVDALLPEHLFEQRKRDGAGLSKAAEPAGAGGQAEPEHTFLAFDLGDQVYALPLDQARAVANIPPEITRLPKTDAVMIGLASVGERLMPLVSMHALLGLTRRENGHGRRLVVAELCGSEVGLLVDGVRSILRVEQSRVGRVPSILNRGAGEARIDAVARTPEGLVSILSAERIFAEATVTDILADGAGRTADHEAVEGSDMEQFILFRLGEEVYGLPIAAVDEVLRLPEKIARAPNAPAFVGGVINHRGAALPLIDQGQRFGAGDAARRDAQRRVVVVRLPDLVAGFVVDAVETVLSVPASVLSATPDLMAGEATVFDRIATVEHDGRMVLLIDPHRLLDQTERALVKGLAERTEVDPA